MSTIFIQWIRISIKFIDNFLWFLTNFLMQLSVTLPIYQLYFKNDKLLFDKIMGCVIMKDITHSEDTTSMCWQSFE